MFKTDWTFKKIENVFYVFLAIIIIIIIWSSRRRSRSSPITTIIVVIITSALRENHDMRFFSPLNSNKDV